MDDLVNTSTSPGESPKPASQMPAIPEESTLSRQLDQECAELVRRLRGSSRMEDVEGAFAFFLGSFAFSGLRAACEDSPWIGQRLKKAVRRNLAGLYQHSGLWRHCIERPYGYPGDYCVLEHVYDESAHSRSVNQLGALLDQWSLTTTLPEAVRGRKDLLRMHLQEVAGRMQQTDGVAQVLSIASGGAREVRELPASAHPNLDLTLIDSDPRSLEYVEGLLAELPGLKVRAARADALDGASISTTVVGDRQYDLIYSFGLFDYLPDDDVVRCLMNFKSLLKTGGSFAFCLKDRRYYDPLFYDLFLDWRFVPRIEDAGAVLAEKAGLHVTGQASVKGRVVHIYFCQARSRA